jgi:hypothetical protein
MATKERKHRDQARKCADSIWAEIEDRVREQARDELVEHGMRAIEQDQKTREARSAREKKFERKPWDQIELWFTVNAWATMNDVARKFGIDANFVRRHAGAHGWATKQAAFRAEVTSRVRAECALRITRKIVDASAPFVDTLMLTAKALLERVHEDATRNPHELMPSDSVTKGVELIGKGDKIREVEVLTRRRAPSMASALHRTIVRTATDLMLKFGGFHVGPREKALDAAEQRSSSPGNDAPTGPTGTTQDFQASFTSALGVMLGPGVAAAAAARTTSAEPKP